MALLENSEDLEPEAKFVEIHPVVKVYSKPNLNYPSHYI